jgi:MFS family permease
LVFCAASSLVSSVIFFVAFSFLSGTPQYILMLFGGIAIVAFVPAGAAVTQDVVHPGLRAISYSICVVVQHILGSSTGPIVIGAISDAYNIQTAMMILPGFTVIAAVLFMLGSLYYEKDLAAVEKVSLSVEE